MLIDKTKFLALVAAISTASAACIIVDDDDGDGIGGENTGAGNEGAGAQGAGNQGGDGGGGNGTGGDGTGGGTNCLGDDGNPPACDSTCEGFTNCNGVANLKDGVEEDMVTCMNALDPVTCSFNDDVLNGCYIDAAAKACVDPASDTACTEAAPACAAEANTEWLGACAAYMDGMNASGQALYQACIEDACGQGTTADDAITFCIYDVLFPTG